MALEDLSIEEKSISVTIASRSKSDEITEHLVTVKSLDKVDASPCHICCVIDVSGSMDELTSVQTAGGALENTGLTVLDVVKHAVRSIVSTLGDEDSVSLVKYADNGAVICKPIKCSKAGKKDLNGYLDSLHTEGCTNLWDGLRVGLEMLREECVGNKQNNFMFLLTDGLPNIVPPRGHEETLKRYIEEKGRLPCSISTFGFGYSLDVSLLRNVASIGTGTFNFIPDAGMVGTVFIHATATAMAVLGQDVTLTVEANGVITNQAEINKNMFQAIATSTGMVIDFGAILSGCNRSLVINSNASSISVTIGYRTFAGEQVFDTSRTSTDSKGFELARSRYALVAGINELLLDLIKETRQGICKYSKKEQCDTQAVIQRVQSEIGEAPETNSLLQDLLGQVSEAVEPAYFQKWGKYYLPSLACAHRFEICTNFKDPGVQQYSEGLVFNRSRATAEKAFLDLPAPKPAIARATPINMGSYFLSSSNPCFLGDCQVRLQDGSIQFVRDVTQGDILLTGSGRFSTVRCVVETRINGSCDMSIFPDGLAISPYHPILVDGEWSFPCQLVEPTLIECDSIFSIVLEEGGQSVVVNGIAAVSLGHGIKTNQVVTHPYLGTLAVIKDLQKIGGWEIGKLLLPRDPFIRDPITNLICGLDAEI